MLPALTFQPAAAAQERSTKWWKAPHQRAKRAEPSLPAPQQKLLRLLKAVCHPGREAVTSPVSGKMKKISRGKTLRTVKATEHGEMENATKQIRQ